MNIAILDDELHCVESLLFHIRQLFPNFKVVFKGTDPIAALPVLKRLDIDLLFLDVEMPGMNGFELLEKFNKLPFDVIFTTAYSRYAIQAFKAKAVYYLLKPIDEEELKEAIKLWREKSLTNGEASNEIHNLLNHLKQENILKNKIAIPVSDGLEFVEVQNILYCQSQNNYTSIFLQNGEKLFISRTLKDVENLLNQFLFIRVHQSYLVNPTYMQKYFRNDGGYILMTNNQRIPLSNSKKSLVAEMFEGIND